DWRCRGRSCSSFLRARETAFAPQFVTQDGLQDRDRGLTVTRLLEELVRLQDLAQTIFRSSITAIRIRMVALYQCFIARLDFRASGLRLKTESFQCFGLKGLHPSGSSCPLTGIFIEQ